MTARRRPTDDRGSALVELVIVTVVFFGFIAAVVFAGRITTGRARVEAAARSAARTISIARDPESAMADAEAQARQMAPEGSAICRTLDFEADIIDRADEPDLVTVDIVCTADMSELALIEVVPGDGEFAASADEVLDVYREEP